MTQGYIPTPDMALGYGMMAGQTSVIPGQRNPPCDTLFVGNLTATITEPELRDIFGRYTGFRRLRLTTKPGPSGGQFCFVEYQDVSCSTEAMNGLQGWVPGTAERSASGMRVEYAKNKIGEMSQRNKESHVGLTTQT